MQQYRHSRVCVYMCVCAYGWLATLMNLPVSCAELSCVVCLASRISCPALFLSPLGLVLIVFNFQHKITCLCLHATELQKPLSLSLPLFFFSAFAFQIETFALSLSRFFCSSSYCARLQIGLASS